MKNENTMKNENSMGNGRIVDNTATVNGGNRAVKEVVTGSANKVRNAGAGKSGKVREVWDRPVSKSFYEKLRVKVSGIVAGLGYVRGYTDVIMKYIDLYIDNGEVPKRVYCEEFLLAIFFTLRCEIDDAARRSAAARLRAAERRARKEAKIDKSDEIGNRQEVLIEAECIERSDADEAKSLNSGKDAKNGGCSSDEECGRKHSEVCDVTVDKTAVDIADDHSCRSGKRQVASRRRRGKSSYCPL